MPSSPYARPRTRLVPRSDPLAAAIGRCLSPCMTRRALALAVAVGLAGPAAAASFVVTNAADSGPGSLRDAVARANALPGRDEIVFGLADDTINLPSGALVITDPLDILGPGSEALSLVGNGVDPVVQFLSGGSLSGLTLGGGSRGLVTSPETADDRVEVADCVIAGNAVGVEVGDLVDPRWLFFQDPSLSIRNCRITSNSDHGITISARQYLGSYHLLLENVRIDGNAGDGIDSFLWNFGVGVARLQGTVIEANGGRGVTCGFGSHCELVDSIVTGNSDTGLYIDYDSYFGASASVHRSTISGNGNGGISLDGDEGGGDLTVDQALILDNVGDGVRVSYAYALAIRNSTIAGNSGFGVSGGSAARTGSTDIESTTVSRNTVGGIGPLDFLNLRLTHSTVSRNGGFQLAGIYSLPGTIEQSIIAGDPNEQDPDIGWFDGSVPALQLAVVHSLIGDPGDTVIDDSAAPGSNLVGIDPLLGPLQDNGGPTPTRLPLPGSPVIDAGDPAFVPPPAFDQRGEGYPRVVNGRIDIGAVEVGEVAEPDTSFYAFAPLGWVDANDATDFALLIGDGDATTVSVRDGITRQAISDFSLDAGDNRVLGIAGLGDFNANGAADAVVLSRRPNGQGWVAIHDGLTGQPLQQLSFAGAAWEARALTALDVNGDGRDDIGVLLVSDDGEAAGIQVGDTVFGGQLVWVGLPSDAGTDYRAVATLDDIDGNGAPELAALRVDSASSAAVIVTDSRSKAPIATVTFDTTGKTVAGLAGVGDIDGSGADELAVLLVKPDGRGRVHLKDAQSGRWLGRLNFLGPDWQALAVASQDVDGDGSDEVSVLGLHDSGDPAAIQLIDAGTGDPVNWIGIPLD